MSPWASRRSGRRARRLGSALDLGDRRSLRQVDELRLHQADDRRLGAARQDAAHELGAEEAGKTGQQYLGHGLYLERHVTAGA